MNSPPSKHEFTKSRHAQRRALVKACRAVTKGTTWRSNQGALFAQRDGWFLTAHEMTKIAVPQTYVRLSIKPMAADPVFWEMVGHPELCDQPLSFRYFGAMTVGSLILGEPEIPEEGGTDEIARQMLSLAEARLQDVAATWCADDFLRGLARKTGRYFTASVTTLLAERRFQEAGQLCDEAAARGSNGGFSSSKLGTFNEMVARWIAAHLSVENAPAAS